MKLDKKGWMPIKPERAAFSQIRETIIRACADMKEAKTCVLVCDEIFQNILEYSGAGRIWFRCKGRGAALELGFMDDGKMFDVVSEMIREKDFEDLNQGGMGLTLIRTLAKNMRYERIEDRNVLFVVVDTDRGFSAHQEIKE